MSLSVILTSKGTTTIPKQVRDDLNLRQGNRIKFERTPSGDYIIKRELTMNEVRELNIKHISSELINLTPSEAKQRAADIKHQEYSKKYKNHE